MASISAQMDAVALDTKELQMVDEVLDLAALVNGDCEAYVEPRTSERTRRSLTFAEWRARAMALATHLRSLGVKRHDVVCLLMGPSIDYAVAYQAIIRCGAVASGINPRLARNEQQSIFDRMAPIVTIAEDDLLPGLGANAGVLISRTVSAELPVAEFTSEPERTSVDLVAVVWTSGTTGLPKGAMFDHRCLRAVSEGTDLLSQPGDRKLSPLPFAHVGYMTRIWDEISNGVTTIITPTPWRPEGALETIVNERVTVAQGVPTQWSLMLELEELADADVSSLRLVSTGAARMAPSQVAALRKHFRAPVVVRYTSTETSLGTGTRLDDDDETVASTVGRPVAGVEMELVDQKGTVVAQGDVGRVRLRSGAVMVGYVAPRDPRRRGVPLEVDELATSAVRSRDGWITTGDFGAVNEQGNLCLVGRDNEMYQRGGYNVYPAEVEQALDGAPGVRSVAVVAGSDNVLGEIGVAFIVPDPEIVPPSREGLKGFLRDRLADYKVPDVVVIVQELPVTAMGKIDKKVLRIEADRAAAERSVGVARARRERS